MARPPMRLSWRQHRRIAALLGALQSRCRQPPGRDGLGRGLPGRPGLGVWEALYTGRVPRGLSGRVHMPPQSHYARPKAVGSMPHSIARRPGRRARLHRPGSAWHRRGRPSARRRLCGGPGARPMQRGNTGPRRCCFPLPCVSGNTISTRASFSPIRCAPVRLCASSRPYVPHSRSPTEAPVQRASVWHPLHTLSTDRSCGRSACSPQATPAPPPCKQSCGHQSPDTSRHLIHS